jgi:hypothetical protein
VHGEVKSENPRDVIEHESDSSKANVWSNFMKNKVITPPIFF